MNIRDFNPADIEIIEEEVPTNISQIPAEEIEIVEPSFLDTAKEKAKEFGEATLEDLPALGAGAGSVVGGITGGPGGAMVGAGLGAYGGKALQNSINRYVHPERAPKTELGYLTEPAKEIYQGTIGEFTGQSLGKGIPKILKGIGSAGKKFLTTLGPTEEAIDARLAGKAQHSGPNKAKNYPQLAEDLAEVHRNLGEETAELDKEAAKTLRQESNISQEIAINPLEREIKNVTSELGTAVGEEDREMIRVLGNFKEDIEKIAPQLTEKQLKALLKRYDKAINWEDQTRDQLNRTLKTLRHELDSYLKDANDAYKDKMQEVSKRTDVLERIREKFNLRHKPGEGIRPTDTTVTKIQTSPRENKAITQEDLKALEELTSKEGKPGRNFADEANDYRLSQQFEKTAPNGSKRTATGAALGTLVGTALQPGLGSLVGGGIGGVVGSTLDRYGGRVAAQIIDTYRKYGTYRVFGPYAEAVKQAVERGPKAVGTLGAILGSDPQFMGLLESE